MPKSLRLVLGTLVACTDGVCGLVQSIVVNPGETAVVHLVVQPEHRVGLGRLVPVELVEDASSDGVDLSCDLEAFEALANAEESHLIPGIATDYVWVGSPAPLLREVHEVLPAGESSVQTRTPVHATDGEVGRVSGFITGSDGRRIIRVLVSQHHLLWGHKTMVLPGSAISGFGSVIDLNLDTAAVAMVASEE